VTNPMMRAVVSCWRLRAVARLVLARRAVARRTERAGAAAARLSTRNCLICWSSRAKRFRALARALRRGLARESTASATASSSTP